jgi:hypothetical protein
MNKLIRFSEYLLETVILFVFGVRAEGIKLPAPSFRSLYPEEQLSEFEWMQMFRVSSLHKVDQRVYLEPSDPSRTLNSDQKEYYLN